MAIIIKSSIKITKGFDTWQAMVNAQENRINEMGIKFLFAGTEKDDPTQLHAIMLFPSTPHQLLGLLVGSVVMLAGAGVTSFFLEPKHKEG